MLSETVVDQVKAIHGTGCTVSARMSLSRGIRTVGTVGHVLRNSTNPVKANGGISITPTGNLLIELCKKNTYLG